MAVGIDTLFSASIIGLVIAAPVVILVELVLERRRAS